MHGCESGGGKEGNEMISPYFMTSLLHQKVTLRTSESLSISKAKYKTWLHLHQL